jgi:hypothetical protein
MGIEEGTVRGSAAPRTGWRLAAPAGGIDDDTIGQTVVIAGAPVDER